MSSRITAQQLGRNFRVPIARQGLLGALKSLVHREYRSIQAVDNLNFTIEAGEAVGFIGPNGAGKSTTVKMLTGILTPSSGSLQVADLTPHQQRHKLAQKIGVVFGQRTQLWWDLPVIESFNLLKHIYHIPDEIYTKRLEQFKDLLKLNDFLQTPVRKLSLGQRVRADIVASLLHDPPILFLDEPTIGLDVEAKDAIRNFLLYLVREEEKTLLLTTHDLNDIEIVCQRLIIIDHGKILFDGNLEKFKERFLNSVRLTLDVEDKKSVYELLPNHITKPDEGAGRLIFDLPRSVMNPAEFLSQVLQKTALHEVKIEEPEIEEIVRTIYRQGGLE